MEIKESKGAKEYVGSPTCKEFPGWKRIRWEGRRRTVKEVSGVGEGKGKKVSEESTGPKVKARTRILGTAEAGVKKPESGRDRNTGEGKQVSRK